MIRTQTSPIGMLGRTLKYLALALLGLWMVLPFFWMISASLMTSQEIQRLPPPFLPAVAQFQNYVEVAKVVPMARAYANSLLVTIFSVAGILFTSSLCGFAFAKYQFPGRDVIFLLILASMMIPFFVILIPVFYIVKQFGWINNYAGVVVPGMVSAYGIFLMRQFIQDIPDELLDAARIDGASEFRIYWQIIIPLSGAALATLGSFNFVTIWNSFLWPLLILQSRDLWTVPLALNSLRTFGAEARVLNLQMAGTALSVIPALIGFLFLQRYFVRGISLTGLKG
ncbi:MAG TPA: carbohydrate ABC transporter permease [Anaerolineae bacterium]|nr:carbohydrate ABC transporter permease [Anaerolineae bacterium]